MFIEILVQNKEYIIYEVNYTSENLFPICVIVDSYGATRYDFRNYKQSWKSLKEMRG